jgi:protein-tyrosine phosphatase
MENICRSAMAEGILRAKLADAGLAGRVGVDSAGTSNANAGRRPDARARLALVRHGGSIRDLRARGLADEDFETFDLILVMDESNRREVLRRARTAAAAAKVRPVLEFVGGGEVPDPVYRVGLRYRLGVR